MGPWGSGKDFTLLTLLNVKKMKSSAVLVLIHCHIAGMISLCWVMLFVSVFHSWKMLRWLRLLLLKHEKAWNWSCKTFRHSWMLCQSPNRRCLTSRCVASFFMAPLPFLKPPMTFINLVDARLELSNSPLVLHTFVKKTRQQEHSCHDFFHYLYL